MDASGMEQDTNPRRDSMERENAGQCQAGYV